MYSISKFTKFGFLHFSPNGNNYQQNSQIVDHAIIYVNGSLFFFLIRINISEIKRFKKFVHATYEVVCTCTFNNTLDKYVQYLYSKAF